MRGVLPFEYIDHLFLSVTLSDTMEAVLVYDPVRGLLLDERFAAREGLATYGGEEVGYGAPVTVGGAGGAEHVVSFARDLVLQYGDGRHGDGQDGVRRFALMPVIPLDSMMAGALGRPVDGLFGIDILADYVLEFDFERDRFVLHDPAAFDPPPDAARVPITWMGRARRPSVPVTLRLASGEHVEGRFLLDFGMGGAFRLTTGFTDAHHLDERIAPTLPSNDQRGLGGALESLYGRVPALTIGPVTVERPVVSLARERVGADAFPEHGGLIGLGLLDRYRAFYNAPGSRLWLAPTARTERPFTYVKTGLRWAPDDDSGRGLMVRDVAPHSPAAEAGLVPGDRLRHVGGVRADRWTRRDWEEAVQAAARRDAGARHLDLRVLRDEALVDVRLRVEDLL